MEAGGIEPTQINGANNDFSNGCDKRADPCAAPALQICGSNCQLLAALDTNLRSSIQAQSGTSQPERLAALWCHLSPHVRESILMLIDADMRRKRCDDDIHA
jgi:hypothetical protein